MKNQDKYKVAFKYQQGVFYVIFAPCFNGSVFVLSFPESKSLQAGNPVHWAAIAAKK
jgi:hypothetical protein